jgi:hypothetical protein
MCYTYKLILLLCYCIKSWSCFCISVLQADLASALLYHKLILLLYYCIRSWSCFCIMYRKLSLLLYYCITSWSCFCVTVFKSWSCFCISVLQADLASALLYYKLLLLLFTVWQADIAFVILYYKLILLLYYCINCQACVTSWVREYHAMRWTASPSPLFTFLPPISRKVIVQDENDVSLNSQER